MIKLRSAELSDISTIQAIANVAFRDTYKELLSEDQIIYMLEMMYSTSSLSNQMNNGQCFILLYDGTCEECQGFVSYETNYQQLDVTKLHKLYINPQMKGRGWGRILVEAVEQKAKEQNNTAISLNMNRDNRTYNFYTYMGFHIVRSEDNPIGNGYLMEDYVLEKTI